MGKDFSKPDGEDESDDYLIELIGLKGEFPEEAKDAYGKLYLRYREFMFAVAVRVTKNIDDAADLLSDTFNMVYNKASTFKKGKAKNPENLRLSISNWMTTIMEHVFYDHYLDEAYKKPSTEENLEDCYLIDKRSIAKHIDDDYDDFIEKLDAPSDFDTVPDITAGGKESESDNLIKVKDYLGKLSERDRDIILTTYNYHTPGKYTPGSVLDELTVRWGTTRDNIRKILEKFKKAIKEELQPQLISRKSATS